jgi:hypothetical protein
MTTLGDAGSHRKSSRLRTTISFHKLLATGQIKYIFKTGKRNDVGSYRGVVILSCFAKLFEVTGMRKESFHLDGKVLVGIQ